MLAELLDGLSHLLFDPLDAQARLAGYFGMTKPIYATCYEYLSGQRFETAHGFLDAAQPITGFKCRHWITIAKRSVLGRNMQSCGRPNFTSSIVDDDVTSGAPQVGLWSFKDAVFLTFKQPRKRAMDDVLGFCVSGGRSYETQQPGAFPAVQHFQ